MAEYKFRSNEGYYHPFKSPEESFDLSFARVCNIEVQSCPGADKQSEQAAFKDLCGRSRVLISYPSFNLVLDCC